LTYPVVLKDPASTGWLLFESPLRIIQAWQVEEVLPALAALEAAATQDRLFAAGFISYEAAPAFDPALVARPDGDFPLLWFGLYKPPQKLDFLPAVENHPDLEAAPNLPLDWLPSVSREAYDQAIAQIKAQIACGKTYQVNYTLRLTTPYHGNPWELFHYLAGWVRRE
jgi:para-aminobenzoate synthetase/4-amino-4-deoxychorismate lyase